MSLHKLKRSFEERRNILIERLDKNRKDLDLSQQHQIYGAIKEIENFLKSIDQYRTLEAESSFDIDLSQEKEWPVLKRTQKILRTAGGKAVEAISFTFVELPVKAHKGISGKIEAYQERRELYKQVQREVEKKMRSKKS